jgi:hypothetical protein
MMDGWVIGHFGAFLRRANPFYPIESKVDGRDRDRTDDLYRVKVARVVYLTNSSWFSLFDSGWFPTVFGAYCSQIVTKLRCEATRDLSNAR